MNLRTLSWSLLVLFLCRTAKASDEDSIRALFSTYWKAWVSADFKTARECMLPADLVDMQKELLPVFLSFTMSSDKETQKFAAAFFDGIPAEKRATLSPKEVYECLSRILVIFGASMFEALKTSKAEVDSVIIDGADAVISYRVLSKGTSDTDSEVLVKWENKWWLRVKENPHETAKKFLKLFKNEG